MESHKSECDCPSGIKDKPTWGPGPWQDEPDRVDFEAHGLPCLLHRGPTGHWCGYAAVPPGHPLHGKSYDDVDYSAVEVHGGLTYATACAGHICHVPKPEEPDDVWWFGFDCAHAGDLIPSIHARYARGLGIPGETYKDVDYVRRETEELARQLASLGKR